MIKSISAEKSEGIPPTSPNEIENLDQDLSNELDEELFNMKKSPKCDNLKRLNDELNQTKSSTDLNKELSPENSGNLSSSNDKTDTNNSQTSSFKKLFKLPSLLKKSSQNSSSQTSNDLSKSTDNTLDSNIVVDQNQSEITKVDKKLNLNEIFKFKKSTKNDETTKDNQDLKTISTSKENLEIEVSESSNLKDKLSNLLKFKKSLSSTGNHSKEDLQKACEENLAKSNEQLNETDNEKSPSIDNQLNKEEIQNETKIKKFNLPKLFQLKKLSKKKETTSELATSDNQELKTNELTASKANLTNIEIKNNESSNLKDKLSDLFKFKKSDKKLPETDLPKSSQENLIKSNEQLNENQPIKEELPVSSDDNLENLTEIDEQSSESKRKFNLSKIFKFKKSVKKEVENKEIAISNNQDIKAVELSKSLSKENLETEAKVSTSESSNLKDKLSDLFKFKKSDKKIQKPTKNDFTKSNEQLPSNNNQLVEETAISSDSNLEPNIVVDQNQSEIDLKIDKKFNLSKIFKIFTKTNNSNEAASTDDKKNSQKSNTNELPKSISKENLTEIKTVESSNLKDKLTNLFKFKKLDKKIQEPNKDDLIKSNEKLTNLEVKEEELPVLIDSNLDNSTKIDKQSSDSKKKFNLPKIFKFKKLVKKEEVENKEIALSDNELKIDLKEAVKDDLTKSVEKLVADQTSKEEVQETNQDLNKSNEQLNLKTVDVDKTKDLVEINEQLLENVVETNKKEVPASIDNLDNSNKDQSNESKKKFNLPKLFKKSIKKDEPITKSSSDSKDDSKPISSIEQPEISTSEETQPFPVNLKIDLKSKIKNLNPLNLLKSNLKIEKTETELTKTDDQFKVEDEKSNIDISKTKDDNQTNEVIEESTTSSLETKANPINLSSIKNKFNPSKLFKKSNKQIDNQINEQSDSQVKNDQSTIELQEVSNLESNKIKNQTNTNSKFNFKNLIKFNKSDKNLKHSLNENAQASNTDELSKSTAAEQLDQTTNLSTEKIETDKNATNLKTKFTLPKLFKLKRSPELNKDKRSKFINKLNLQLPSLSSLIKRKQANKSSNLIGTAEDLHLVREKTCLSTIVENNESNENIEEQEACSENQNNNKTPETAKKIEKKLTIVEAEKPVKALSPSSEQRTIWSAIKETFSHKSQRHLEGGDSSIEPTVDETGYESQVDADLEVEEFSTADVTVSEDKHQQQNATPIDQELNGNESNSENSLSSKHDSGKDESLLEESSISDAKNDTNKIKSRKEARKAKKLKKQQRTVNANELTSPEEEGTCDMIVKSINKNKTEKKKRQKKRKQFDQLIEKELKEPLKKVDEELSQKSGFKITIKNGATKEDEINLIEQVIASKIKESEPVLDDKKLIEQEELEILEAISESKDLQLDSTASKDKQQIKIQNKRKARKWLRVNRLLNRSQSNTTSHISSNLTSNLVQGFIRLTMPNLDLLSSTV